jgi:hypothetical protein
LLALDIKLARTDIRFRHPGGQDAVLAGGVEQRIGVVAGVIEAAYGEGRSRLWGRRAGMDRSAAWFGSQTEREWTRSRQQHI